MRVALVGYGKMGKEIERILTNRGHSISARISSANFEVIETLSPENTDVCIEFTNPQSAYHNLKLLINKGLDVVCGSTGWYTDIDNIRQLVNSKQTAFISATNFSVGVNLFFDAARKLAQIMHPHPEYHLRIEETHHTEKKDAPSGTAITLSERISTIYDHYDGFALNTIEDPNRLPIFAYRDANVPGTHILKFTSSIDELSLSHIAYNRQGFAMGAVLAAEYIQGKSGIFTIEQVLGLDK